MADEITDLTPLFAQIGKRSELTLGILEKNSQMIDTLAARTKSLEDAMATVAQSSLELAELVHRLVDLGSGAQEAADEDADTEDE